ncbi:MAG: DUF4384 domain-containing protein [Gemmatimonadales bacterium]|nr:DUF4384 domain-containing protein [Gemmatimonadales bacterium]
MKREFNPTGSAKASGLGASPWLLLTFVAVSLLLPLNSGNAQTGSVPAVAISESSEFDYNQSLRVGVWLDKAEDDVYRRGENIEVDLQANGDGYAVVYRIDVEGLVTILWPRTRMDDGFVFGGHEYRLPVSGARRLRVSGQEGLGYIEAIFSSYPFDLRDLEIDFHHEDRSRTHDFYVAGDPFLAMNEVNFAITGLEDAAEYVVTDYASYYVHEKVEHPRYLCNQCHYDDTVAYHPYRDHCTLEINYDFGWSNSWYGRYGYYPVYWHPTYVYMDPWTYRPWVNFWYYPSYSCPPRGHYNWGYSTYVWFDSPYYRGDSVAYWNSGNRRYRPLGRIAVETPVRKTRDYVGVSSRIKVRSLDDNQRVAMKTRTPVSRKSIRDGVMVKDGIRTADRSSLKGERPVVRTRSKFTVKDQTRERPGLRVRDGNLTGSNVRSNVRPNLRHTAGGSKSRPALNPVVGKKPTTRGNPGQTGLSGERPVPRRNDNLQKDGRGSQGTIKPVEPRKKGTRVWNRGTYESGKDRPKGGLENRGSVRNVRPNDKERSSGKAVRPRPSGKDGGERSKVSPVPRKSGKTTIRPPSKQSSPKVRQDKGSKSSNSKSSTGSSKGSSSRSDNRSGSSSKNGSKKSGNDSRRR